MLKPVEIRMRRPNIAMFAIGLLLVILAIGGGSSRYEVPLLVLIQPLSVVAIGVFLSFRSRDLDVESVRPQLMMLGLLGATIAVQLIPLPPAIWQSLPQHSRYAEAASLTGEFQRWRPISIVPILSLNSLLALLPTLAILLGFARLGTSQQGRVGPALVVLAGLSAVWGIIQLGSGVNGWAYLYREVSEGLPDGFFANRNHQAMFLSGVVPLLAVWTASADRRRGSRAPRQRMMVGSVAAVVLLLTVLATGSRSGLILMGANMIGGLWLFLQLGGHGRGRTILAWLAAAAGGLALIVSVAIASGRATGFARFLVLREPAAEMRFAAIPVLQRLSVDYLPWGSGFGTFNTVFRMYEPDNLLKPTYFNAAHNDLIELLITGGMPAMAVLLIFFGWYITRCWSVFGSSLRPDEVDRAYGQAGAMLLATILLASLSDYPLRTPLAAAVAALASGLLERGRKGPSPGGHSTL